MESKKISRSSEQSEESISMSLLMGQDSLVTSFPQIDGAKSAFTLAEVLITLGIIGVVAAMTMPSLIANYQDNVRKQQFKKAYNILNNAMIKTKSDFGYSPMCHAWEKQSDRPAIAECSDKNDFGTCIDWSCGGGACPPNLNGMYEDCNTFLPAFLKNLNIVKTCTTNGYSNGCIKNI